MVATPVQIAPSDMRGGRAADFSAGHLCPMEKSLPCRKTLCQLDAAFFCQGVTVKGDTSPFTDSSRVSKGAATSRRESFGFL